MPFTISIFLSIFSATPFAVGALIALFERAVGIYAAMINVNAYHQPGVQAGKVAADSIIKLKLRITNHLSAHPTESFTAEQLASATGSSDQIETVFKLCEHLASNPSRGYSRTAGTTPFNSRYHKQ